MLNSEKVLIRNTPWPIALLIVSFVMPIEFSIHLGDLLITPTRFLLILFIVPVILKSAKFSKIELYEYLLMGYALWILVSMTVNYDIIKSFESGGVLVLEALVSYFVVKCYITTVNHIQSLLKFIAAIAIILLPFLVIENITGAHFFHNFFSSITGFHYPLRYEERLGLTRAYGPFSHPILSGVFFAALIGFFWYGARHSLTKKLWQMSILAGAAFTSLSSAPILMVIFQVAAIFWNRIADRIKVRWKLVVAGMASLYVFLFFWSPYSPVMVILSKITMDPQTAYWRMLIWDYGTAEVGRNPVAGIGFGDWIRPVWMISDSVDNFWLLQAMRYGLPAVLFLAVAVLLLMLKVNSLKDQAENKEYKMISLGWIVSVISIVMVGFTVDFFGNNRPFFFFLMGIGAAIVNMQQLALKDAPKDIS